MLLKWTSYSSYLFIHIKFREQTVSMELYKKHNGVFTTKTVIHILFIWLFCISFHQDNFSEIIDDESIEIEKENRFCIRRSIVYNNGPVTAVTYLFI